MVQHLDILMIFLMKVEIVVVATMLDLDCNHSRRQQQQQRHPRGIVGRSWAKALCSKEELDSG
jgi:hypothetical protein